jgi:ribosomal protein S18 acetylase RimI-like enzyme
MAPIEPFTDQHLDGAARLLAARHDAHRATEPLVADADCRAALEMAWRKPRASGAVALRDGRVAAYVIGRVAENDVWSTHAWVDRAGSASTDAEPARDVYAAAAPAWLAAGARLHLALVPAVAAMLDPWYRLGFGQMQLHAVREPGGSPRPLPAGVTVRRGGIDDLETAALATGTLIWEHQALSPAFTGLTPPDEDELRADWTETLQDADVAFFVAERDGRVAGHTMLHPAGPDFGVGPKTLHLSTAAVLPDHRGRGIGTALAEHALAWAAEAGYACVDTDCRVPNLLSSRFWPARGFRPTFHRLYRMLEIG